eukprot:5590678-Amphidinium_carterae.1
MEIVEREERKTNKSKKQQISNKTKNKRKLYQNCTYAEEAYWDDPTPYGMRIYFIVHYYLSDNTMEVNEAELQCPELNT